MNIILSKNNYELIGPKDFRMISLPKPFGDVSFEYLYLKEDPPKFFFPLFDLVPSVIKTSMSKVCREFRQTLFPPLIAPVEYQSNH
jgi:hypothetical protein